MNYRRYGSFIMDKLAKRKIIQYLNEVNIYMVSSWSILILSQSKVENLMKFVVGQINVFFSSQFKFIKNKRGMDSINN